MKECKNDMSYRLIYFLLYVPCFLIGRNLDNDIWFILNSGRYVIHNGIPYIEPFTIHQGMSLVMQQWLSAIIFWDFYCILGNFGLILIVILVYIFFVYMVFKLAMLMSDGNFWVSYTISYMVVFLIRIFMVQRPYIFLFVIIVFELYLLEKYIKFNKFIYILPLLILSVLLINLEAAMWPMLFVIMIPYIIDSFKFKFSFIKGQGYSKKNILLITLGMFFVGLINPYGIKAITYLFTSYGADELSIIMEMSPINVNTFLGKLMLMTVLLVYLSFVIFKNKSSKLRYYLLAIGTTYMTFSSVRNYSIFIICSIIPLSYYFKDFNFNKFENKNDKKTLFIRKILISLLVVLVVVILIFINNIKSNSAHQDLVKCVNYLDRYNKSDIKLYTGFNDGGYLEFRGFKVYIDPRADVFLKSNNKTYDIMKEFVELYSGKIYYKTVLDKYNFNFLLVEKNDILYNYLDHDKDYKLIYSSGTYKVYQLK